MRILFVYQFCTLGGVETVLLGRLRELEALGHEARVLFLDGGTGHGMFAGFEEQVLCGGSPQDAQRFAADFAPSVILFIDCPAGMRLLDAFTCPWVLEVHTTYPEGLQYLANPSMDERVAGLVVPSSGQRQFVLKQFPALAAKSIQIVPNPLPPVFAERFAAHVPPRPVVGWVGRLDALKNWPKFLEQAAALARGQDDLRFWVIGGLRSPPDAKSEFWRQLKRWRLADRLTWLPAVNHCLMPRVYACIALAGGCVVSTSCNESFGMVALEALSQECPVVAPAVGGFTDVAVSPLDQLLFPPDDWAAGLAIVRRLLRDPYLRESLGTFGRRHVLEHYSARKAVQDLIRAIERLCKPAVVGD